MKVSYNMDRRDRNGIGIPDRYGSSADTPPGLCVLAGHVQDQLFLRFRPANNLIL